MTISTIRHSEPLFVVIFRHAQANPLLRAWANQNRVPTNQIQDNRLHLYDHHALSTFIITWQQGWDHVVIWDTWNKRHLDIQNS